eukprot:12848263-Alexandrium_andersonii.AAC.1
MSASLVGSEMCIRDSTSRVLKGPLEEAYSTRLPESPPPELPPTPRGATTVSYTHLTLPTICSV